MKFDIPLWATLVASVLAEDYLFVDTNTGEELNRVIANKWTYKIVTVDEFQNMTTEDFTKFKAIVVPDPKCSTDMKRYTSFLNETKETWSPAVQGNMILIGICKLVGLYGYIRDANRW